MDVSIINECMVYFVDLIGQFLLSPFGYYFCGSLVAILCFGLLLRLLSFK